MKQAMTNIKKQKLSITNQVIKNIGFPNGTCSSCMQCDAMQCNAMRCDAMRCNAMQCTHAMQCKENNKNMKTKKNYNIYKHSRKQQ